MAIGASPILPDRKYLVGMTESKQLENIPEPKPFEELIGLVYDLKQWLLDQAEADFWGKEYERSARAQRTWELKQRNEE